MHISLTPKLEKMIRDKVESGDYNNASEVVREALRLMAAEEAEYQAKLQSLRALLEAGERSGIAENFSIENLQAELDREAEEEGLDK